MTHQIEPAKSTKTSSFTRTFGVCALFAAIAFTTCHAASAENPVGLTTNAVPADTALAIIHGPFVQSPSETGVTLSWATSRKCVSRVEYRPESSTHWLTNIPAHHGLADADVTVHNVTITGLKPGTTYRYRAVSREIVEFKAYKVTFGATIASPECRFTTLDPRKPGTAFVVMNDRHENVVPLAASLASVAWANVDLVFFNGDMVNSVKDEAQLYRCVVDPCVKSFATCIPLVYVRGNHDTRGSFARRLLDYFPTDSGRYYYTLRQGPVLFLVLDSGEDKGDDNSEYAGLVDFEPYLRGEVAWLGRQIEEPAFRNAPFRVCVMHIPPARKPDPKFVRPQWLLDNVVPLLNRGKVDLLICGHTHHYATQPAGPNGLNFPMIIGGTDTVIRCDATAEQIGVTSSDLSGKVLPQLPSIKLRAGK
jgi:predicted phosphodiesterase